MCSSLPQSMTEFSGLSGVGERKLEKYGEKFLQTIRNASPAS
jgi:superfamily II DNA helicase RecQ